MTRKRFHGLITLAVICALALSACGSDSSDSQSSTTKGAEGDALPACPLDALQKATSPVSITVWHQFSENNQTVFQQLIDQFNKSQTKVKVTAVQLPSYDDILAKYQQGLTGGDLPDLAQLEDTNLQYAADSQSVLPVQSCVNADKYSLDKLLPTSVAYYSIKNVLYGMPFNVSVPVLYYDKSDFKTAGLDPNQPPTSFQELQADATKLKGVGIKVPFAFNVDPWYVDQWRSLANQISVNEENGRAGRATKALIGDKTQNAIFDNFATMAKDGTVQAYDRNKFDNMLAVASGDATMTIFTSAGIGTALKVLQSGGQADKNLEFGVAPMPRISASDKGGMSVGGAGLYIVNKSSPERQAASWEFIKFLMTAQSQATWSVGSGYVPNNTDAVNLPEVQNAWAQTPGYKVAYDAILDAPKTPATAGIVLGAYGQFRTAVETQLTKVITAGAAPGPAVTAAEQEANQAIEDYNARVAG